MLGGRLSAIPGTFLSIPAGLRSFELPRLARDAAAGLLRVVPHFTIELARTSTTGIQDKDLVRMLDGLRKAGLPE